jgi:hypothetical protein
LLVTSSNACFLQTTFFSSCINFLALQIDVFYYYYPKRLGQVLFVDAPFVFQPLWQMVKPLLKSYATLVSNVSLKHFSLIYNAFSEMSVILPSIAFNASAYQVRFCDVETVRKEYFTEETVPPDFRG